MLSDDLRDYIVHPPIRLSGTAPDDEPDVAEDLDDRVTRLFLRETAPKSPIRRWTIPGCSTCAREGHPPHDASPVCESGGYTHCSCEVCF